jgi:hypothetical protein
VIVIAPPDRAVNTPETCHPPTMCLAMALLQLENDGKS